MTYLNENWPMAASIAAFIVALLPMIRVYTGYLSHRSSHKKSQIDALRIVADMDVAKLNPEQALVLDAAVSYAYNEEISVETYRALRAANEPGVAARRFRFIRPFVELSDSGDGFRYKRRRLLFRARDSVIPVWRVMVIYSLLYLAFSLTGAYLVLLGASAVVDASWIWFMSLTPIGVALFGIGIICFQIGDRFERHIGAFREATANIFESGSR